MSDTPLQFTKRQLQAAGTSPLLWAALAGAALILGLAGPFGTYDVLPLPGRLAYWALVVVATYFIGFTTVTVLEALFFRQGLSPAGFALLGAASGPFVAFAPWTINHWVFGYSEIGYAALAGYGAAVGAVASGTVAFFLARLERDKPAETPAPPPRPAILDRLPADRRGRILHLSMQDHYVEVVTERGAHLVLMRLSDAIAETRGIEGLQIHRSHWVAQDAVVDSVRRGDRLMLRLINGTELPVSRSRLAGLREAGLA